MNYCRTSSGDVLRSTSVLQGIPEKREFGTCLHTHTVLLFYVLPLCKPQSHRAIMPRWRYTNIQLWHCWHDDDDDDDEASALSQDCLNLRPQTLERTQLHLCFEFATSQKKPTTPYFLSLWPRQQFRRRLPIFLSTFWTFVSRDQIRSHRRTRSIINVGSARRLGGYCDTSPSTCSLLGVIAVLYNKETHCDIYCQS